MIGRNWIASVHASLAAATSWQWWVLRHRIESARQSLRSAAKCAIMAGVNGACTFGEWLIRVLALGDA